MTDAPFDTLPGEIEKFLSSERKPVRFTVYDGFYQLELDAHAVNLETLARTIFSQFGNLLDSIPPELMEMLDVSLTFVSINPTEGRFAFTVHFDQTWGINPIFEIENPEITFYYYNRHFVGVINTTVHFGIDFEAEIEFPGTAIRAHTLPGTYRLADLLAYFSIDATGVGPFEKIHLSEASVAVETMLQTAAIYVAFADVFELGIFQMNELIFDLRYRWGANSGLSGNAQTTITLGIPGHDIVVGLYGAHEAGAGWLFEAYADLEDITLAGMVNWIGEKVAVDPATLPIPESLLEIGLKSLNISYSTMDKSFHFVVLLELGEAAELELAIAIHDQADSDPNTHQATSLAASTGNGQGAASQNGTAVRAGSKQINLRGTLYLNRGTAKEIDLLAIFDKTGSASNFVAVFHPTTPRAVSILDLVSPVIEVSAEAVPDLEIELSSIIFAHIGTTAQSELHSPSQSGTATNRKNRLNETGINILSIDLGGGLDLSGLGDLPVVGSTIGNASSLHLNFQLTYSTGNLPKGENPTGNPAQHINDLLQEYNVSLPPEVPAGFSIKTQLRLGADGQPMDVQFGGSSNVVESKHQDLIQNSALGAPNPREGSPAITTSAGDEAVKWYPIQKVFGPIHVGRVGFKYVDQKVTAYLDASLSLSVLTITLMGLSASFRFPVSEISELAPSFSLDGLGLEFKKGAVELSGAFLRSQFLDPDTNLPMTSYDGAVTIRTATVTLSAVGSFAQFSDGSPSAFIYGILNYPIGGPPVFFVLGLAAGFGYNRDLIVPEDLSKIADHWLVKDALEVSSNAKDRKALPSSNTKSGNGRTGENAPEESASETNVIVEKLHQVHASVPPKKGQNFLAAGIRFSTFQLLDSFVLVTVAFGQRFELNIIGISTMNLPPKAPATPLTVVQLLIRARFAPDEGEVSVQGQLTDNSYLLSPDNHLTGGFAFATWFKGTHEGDFVVTFGGYHPAFQKPTHYPTVPRIGFNWVVNQHLTIKGGVYLGLTPGNIMAGGALNAVWNSDEANASFLVGADFLMAWKPFHYDIKAYISIHADATIDYGLGTSHESFDASANLHIWGPEFGGHADVSVTVIGIDFDFEIDFGAKPNPNTTIGWGEFRESFLDGKPQTDGSPPAELKPLSSISITKGLNRELRGEQATRFSLQPKEIEIRVDTVIPFKTVNQRPVAITNSDEAKTIANNLAALMVVPVGEAVNESNLELTIVNHEGEDVLAHFELIPMPKKVPSALWGTKQPEMNDEERVVTLVSGLQIRAKRHPEEQEQSKTVARTDLAFHEIAPIPVTLDWAQQTQGWDAVQDADSTYERMLDQTTRSQRHDLLIAFGFRNYQENIQQVDPLVTDNSAQDEN